MFFGLIRPYKGLDLFIRACAKLRNTGIDFQGLIIGEAYEDSQPYHDLISEHNLDNVIEFREEFVPDEDVPGYFAAADALVLPYRSATQSGIVGIAMHLERPVIATRVGGLDEYILDGETGFLVPPEDPDALAVAMEKILADGVLPGMQARLREHKHNFSIEKFCLLLEAGLE
jgi:glycosyltransferase involved in cell wall biosynthesis